MEVPFAISDLIPEGSGEKEDEIFGDAIPIRTWSRGRALSFSGLPPNPDGSISVHASEEYEAGDLLNYFASIENKENDSVEPDDGENETENKNPDNENEGDDFDFEDEGVEEPSHTLEESQKDYEDDDFVFEDSKEFGSPKMIAKIEKNDSKSIEKSVDNDNENYYEEDFSQINSSLTQVAHSNSLEEVNFASLNSSTEVSTYSAIEKNDVVDYISADQEDDVDIGAIEEEDDDDDGLIPGQNLGLQGYRFSESMIQDMDQHLRELGSQGNNERDLFDGIIDEYQVNVDQLSQPKTSIQERSMASAGVSQPVTGSSNIVTDEKIMEKDNGHDKWMPRMIPVTGAPYDCIAYYDHDPNDDAENLGDGIEEYMGNDDDEDDEDDNDEDEEDDGGNDGEEDDDNLQYKNEDEGYELEEQRDEVLLENGNEVDPYYDSQQTFGSHNRKELVSYRERRSSGEQDDGERPFFGDDSQQGIPRKFATSKRYKKVKSTINMKKMKVPRKPGKPKLSRFEADERHKIWLMEVAAKKRQEEEELLEVMEKQQAKRKKFKEALLEKALKARSESATVADSPAAINRNIEYSNAAEPVVSIDKKIAVANNNAYQKPPKKLNRKLHADEDRDEKEWMKQKVVYDENNEETNNEGDENGDDDEEKSIIEEKLSELELQKREEIAQIRRKFKEKHKTLLMKLKQKNDAEAEKIAKQREDDLRKKEAHRKKIQMLVDRRSQQQQQQQQQQQHFQSQWQQEAPSLDERNKESITKDQILPDEEDSTIPSNSGNVNDESSSDNKTQEEDINDGAELKSLEEEVLILEREQQREELEVCRSFEEKSWTIKQVAVELGMDKEIDLKKKPSGIPLRKTTKRASAQLKSSQHEGELGTQMMMSKDLSSIDEASSSSMISSKTPIPLMREHSADGVLEKAKRKAGNGNDNKKINRLAGGGLAAIRGQRAVREGESEKKEVDEDDSADVRETEEEKQLRRERMKQQREKVAQHLLMLQEQRRQEAEEKKKKEDRLKKRVSLLSERLLQEANERKGNVTEDSCNEVSNTPATNVVNQGSKNSVSASNPSNSSNSRPAKQGSKDSSSLNKVTHHTQQNNNSANMTATTAGNIASSASAIASTASNGNNAGNNNSNNESKDYTGVKVSAEAAEALIARLTAAPVSTGNSDANSNFRDFADWKRKHGVSSDTPVFCMTGWYPCVKEDLLARGWAFNPDSSSPFFDLKWSLRSLEVNSSDLQSWQLTNHFQKNVAVTTKAGLWKSLQSLPWRVDQSLLEIVPRAYDLSHPQEFQAFLDDFRAQEASAYLKMLYEKATGKNGPRQFRKSEKGCDATTSTAMSATKSIKDKKKATEEDNNDINDDDDDENSDKKKDNDNSNDDDNANVADHIQAESKDLSSIPASFEDYFEEILEDETIPDVDFQASIKDSPLSINVAVFDALVRVVSRVTRPLEDHFLDGWISTYGGGQASEDDWFWESMTITPLEWELISKYSLWSPATLSDPPMEAVDAFLRSSHYSDTEMTSNAFQMMLKKRERMEKNQREKSRQDLKKMQTFSFDHLQLVHHLLWKLEIIDRGQRGLNGRGEQSQNLWIIKPAAKSRGRGIATFGNLNKLLRYIESGSGVILSVSGSSNTTNSNGNSGSNNNNNSSNNNNNNLLAGCNQWIVQKYMENSLLINNHKFDLRQWVLVTDWNPLTIYFYDECYARFSVDEYSTDEKDLDNVYSHLVNNSIGKYSENFTKRFFTENGMEVEGYMMSFSNFRKYMKYKAGGQDVVMDRIQPRMKEIAQWSLMCAADTIEHRKNSWELYGFDFMIDDAFMPWLIEINSSPACDYSTSVTEVYVKRALVDILKVVLDLRAWENPGNRYPNKARAVIAGPSNASSSSTSSKGSPPDLGGWQCIYKGPLLERPLASFGSEMVIKGEACAGTKNRHGMSGVRNATVVAPPVAIASGSNGNIGNFSPLTMVASASQNAGSTLSATAATTSSKTNVSRLSSGSTLKNRTQGIPKSTSITRKSLDGSNSVDSSSLCDDSFFDGENEDMQGDDNGVSAPMVTTSSLSVMSSKTLNKSSKNLKNIGGNNLNKNNRTNLPPSGSTMAMRDDFTDDFNDDMNDDLSLDDQDDGKNVDNDLDDDQVDPEGEILKNGIPAKFANVPVKAIPIKTFTLEF